MRKITKEELRLHNKAASENKEGDIWVLVNGKVYDLSKYYKKHPGGPDIIEENAGTDVSKIYKDAGHPQSAKKEME